MKTILIIFTLAGFTFGQTLPYELSYKNEKGWPEVMVFSQSPDDPNVILISLYSYVNAQTPYYKFKETKPAGDTKKVLGLIAQWQANDMAKQRAEAQRNIAAEAAAAQSARDASNARRIGVEVENAVEDALRRDRRRYGR